MAIARMAVRRRAERLDFWWSVMLTSWFMGFMIGVAHGGCYACIQ